MTYQSTADLDNQHYSLDLNAAEVTNLGYTGVAVVFSVVFSLSILLPVPWDTLWTIGLTGSVAVFAWLVRIGLHYQEITPQLAHPALFLLTALMGTHTGIVLYLIGDPVHSGNQILTMLAAAFFLAARPWFYPAILLIVCAWLPAAVSGLQDEELAPAWNQWSRVLLVGTALAIAFFEARRRSVLRIFQHRVEAERALEREQAANAERLKLEKVVQESQRLESLGVLAGGVAHDFNNLLAVLKGNIELLMTGNDQQYEKAELLQDMNEASERAIQLTRQMLVYAGQATPNVAPLDVGHQIRSVARFMASTASPRAELILESEQDGPRIRADATQFDQLLMNIIQNALDACDGDYGQVRLSWGETTASAEQLAEMTFATPAVPGRYATIDITDNGQGMHENTQARVLEPFYSTKADRRGLGLAVATGILRAHNAGIQIRSRIYQGTTVHLAIPLDSATESPESGHR